MMAVAAATPAAFSPNAWLAWYCEEFAAANAIIDALCGHLVQISGAAAGVEYESVFAALRRRRINWSSVLRFQTFYPISEVTHELHRIAAARSAAVAAITCYAYKPPDESTLEAEIPDSTTLPAKDADALLLQSQFVQIDESNIDCAGKEEADGEHSSGDSSERNPAEEDGGSGDGRSQGEKSSIESCQICSNHEDCLFRQDRIKTLTGLVAKEPVKGHTVNVTKGLKVHDNIFTAAELLKLSEFIDDLRRAGRSGELSGETFILFNKQIKGNKREIIQLGVPLFQPAGEEASSKPLLACNIEPIPAVLQDVVDHLVLWRLIPEIRKPNSCIISFFDEDEYSQPYFKPPHLDNPISTLVLSETSMAFGRVLVADQDGNYKAPLNLSLKKGSLVVMRGNSADMARHVVSASPNKRVTITFVKVRTSDTSPTAKEMTVWQPGADATPRKPTESAAISYGTTHVAVPRGWGRMEPLVMMSPLGAVVAVDGYRRTTSGGTGVFLPWGAVVGAKKYNKQLPPRILKRRFSSVTMTRLEKPKVDRGISEFVVNVG